MKLLVLLPFWKFAFVDAVNDANFAMWRNFIILDPQKPLHALDENDFGNCVAILRHSSDISMQWKFLILQMVCFVSSLTQTQEKDVIYCLELLKENCEEFTKEIRCRLGYLIKFLLDDVVSCNDKTIAERAFVLAAQIFRSWLSSNVEVHPILFSPFLRFLLETKGGSYGVEDVMYVLEYFREKYGEATKDLFSLVFAQLLVNGRPIPRHNVIHDCSTKDFQKAFRSIEQNAEDVKKLIASLKDHERQVKEEKEKKKIQFMLSVAERQQDVLLKRANSNA